MARGKMIPVEEKLKRAEAVMMDAKRKYDEAVEEVNRLLKLCDEKKKEELFEAAMNSSRSFEEILAFIQSGENNNEDE